MNRAVIRNCLKYCLLISPAVFQIAHGQNFGIVTLPGSLADPGVQIQRAATSTPKLNQWCEGPAVAQNGNLFISEQNAGNIWKVTPSGTMTKLITIGTYSNGLDFDPVNRHLVVCEKSQMTERDTGTGAVLKIITRDAASVWTGGGSGGSNDLTFASNGDLFFTCWNQHIYFHSKDSSVNQDWNFPTSYGTCQWNGIEYIEEKGIMYVCQYGKNRVVTFKVSPTTHMIDTSTMKQFGPAMYAPDGITVDSNYNVYVCSNSGQGSYPNSVVVLDSSGTVLGSIKMTQTVSSAAVNCVFGTSMFGGGPNSYTLYITGDSGAFKVQLKVAGRVRPNGSAVRQGDNRHRFSGSGILGNTGIVAIRSRSGMQFRSSLGSLVKITLFSPSGKRLEAFHIAHNQSILWRPPSRGAFICGVSGNGRTFSKTIFYE
jgi:sugar lactone lactonase YvrE